MINTIKVGLLYLAWVVIIDTSEGFRLSRSATAIDDGFRHQGITPHPSILATIERPLLLLRVRRGSAYAGGYNDFSGVAKQSTFSALGSYGGFLGHGQQHSAGKQTVPQALGSYGQYVPGGHGGPTVLSSGGYGQGGLLFGKI